MIFSKRASAFFSSLLFFFWTFGTYGFGTIFFGSKNAGVLGFKPLALSLLYAKIAFLWAYFLAFLSALYFFTAAFFAAALAFLASLNFLACKANF